MSTTKKAIILLSGGLDSTTVLAMAKNEGYQAYALSFNYGQRHDIELRAARRISSSYQVQQHLIIDIPATVFGDSALTSDTQVPKGRDAEEISHGIPVTYVPARNTLFLSYALAWCETLQARDIFIGVNAVDYSGYPDCRPEFIAAYQQMANLATQLSTEKQQSIKIHTPLANLSKSQIIQKGLLLGVDYSLTNSCYDPSAEGKPCGTCDACQLRHKGFSELGMHDPLLA